MHLLTAHHRGILTHRDKAHLLVVVFPSREQVHRLGVRCHHLAQEVEEDKNFSKLKLIDIKNYKYHS